MRCTRSRTNYKFKRIHTYSREDIGFTLIFKNNHMNLDEQLFSTVCKVCTYVCCRFCGDQFTNGYFLYFVLLHGLSLYNIQTNAPCQLTIINIRNIMRQIPAGLKKVALNIQNAIYPFIDFELKTNKKFYKKLKKLIIIEFFFNVLISFLCYFNFTIWNPNKTITK